MNHLLLSAAWGVYSALIFCGGYQCGRYLERKLHRQRLQALVDKMECPPQVNCANDAQRNSIENEQAQLKSMASKVDRLSRGEKSNE